MKYVPRRLRPNRYVGPRYILQYPADKRITHEQADFIKKKWLEASYSKVPLIIPDDFKVVKLR